jgi:hypothetical protein
MHAITIHSNKSLKYKIETILQRPLKHIGIDVCTQTETDDKIEKTIQLLEWIEKNTKVKKKERLTIVYNLLAIMGLCIAMTFTFTMMYILWIGFYPPTRLFQSIFFIDRLYDFRDFLEGLRNGSILQYLSDMMIKSFETSIKKSFSEMNMTTLNFSNSSLSPMRPL